MPRPSDLRRRTQQRGYALLAVIVFTILILTGATIVLVLARDKAIATVKDKQQTEAYGIALAGLNYLVANVDNPAEKTAMFNLANGIVGSPQLINGKNVYRFNADDQLGGVPGPAPQRGTTTAVWTALATGHYGLSIDRDPLNQQAAAVLRAVGVVGDTQVILETNLTVNLAAIVPAGFVGCFQNGTDIDVQLKSGPQDYVANYRFDGNGGAPMGLEFEHNRFNGVSKVDGGNPAVFAMGGLPQGRAWRGSQSLGTLGNVGTVSNKFGGEQAANMLDPGARAPLAGWERNPALANDPRVVDMNDAFKKGLGLSPLPLSVAAEPVRVQLGTDPFILDGQALLKVSATASLANLRAVPLIALDDEMEDESGLVFGETEWDGDADSRGAVGFYGCHAMNSNTNPEEVVQQCLSDKEDAYNQGGGNSTDPDFKGVGVQESGFAWGVVQSVLRHCTGSGDNVDPDNGDPWRDGNNKNGIACEAGFDHLKNVAACLVVPRSVTANNGGVQDTNDGVNRGVNAARDALANLQPDLTTAKLDDDFTGCHPGCLLAVDAADDNSASPLQNEDRPFRSFCVNLDPTKATTYGPTAYPAAITLKDAAFAVGNVQRDSGALPLTINATEIIAVDGDMANHSSYAGWAAYQTAQTIDTTGVTPLLEFYDKGRTLPAVVAPVRRVGGAVSEVGSPHFITRLDLTDRGPLGTCEQNCLAYDWGVDVTYGAHRTDVGVNPVARDDLIDVDGDGIPDAGKGRCAAKVPLPGGGFTYEHCNLDYDRDGFLDRKSYALASAYPEECADPHDGISWAPAVNINAAANPVMANAVGCDNNLPNFLADQDADGRATLPTYKIREFCGTTNELQLNEAIDALLAVSTEITPAMLNKSGPTLNDGAGWFGGARCHMGTQVTNFVGHPTVGSISHAVDLAHSNMATLPADDTDRFGNPDYWIEDVCPDPVVLRMRASANVSVGDVCGCGVLILNNNTLQWGASDHFLWRGIIVWVIRSGGTKDLNFGSDNDDATLVVEGSMIAYGGGKMTFSIDKTVDNGVNIVDGNGNDGHIKIIWRLNEAAISDALSATPTPIRLLRKLR